MDPIDFHYHGIDGLDLQKEPGKILDEVEIRLAKEGIRAVLTFGIPESMFTNFIRFMHIFNERKQLGKHIYVVGIAIEGPLLTSPGGTPKQGVWLPNKDQWKQIADCGVLGLRYVVISPDVNLKEKHIKSSFQNQFPSNIEWILNTILDGNVLPSLGHFSKDSPDDCAKSIDAVFNLIRKRGAGPIVTDHLFNDMPLNFKHAWRTVDEKHEREIDLARLDLPNWNWRNLKEKMGIVPATLIFGAREGLLKLCLNFDGDHVDLAICKKTIDIVGADNIMIMTDRFPQEISGGQLLMRKDGSTLLYQEQGIVAGGTQGLWQQINNMRSIEISTSDIEKITSLVPAKLLNIPTNLVQD